MNPALAWLIEAINRLKTKSPKFFFVLQCITGGMFLLGWLPWALERWTPITPSEYLINFCKDISKVAGGMLLSALFPTRSPIAAQTPTGEAVLVTNEKKMPFTAKAEAKAIEEKEPPPPVIDTIDPST